MALQEAVASLDALLAKDRRVDCRYGRCGRFAQVQASQEYPLPSSSQEICRCSQIFSGREPSNLLQSAHPGAHFQVYDKPDIHHKQLRRDIRPGILLDGLPSESSDTRRVQQGERLRVHRSGTPTCSCSPSYRGHPLLPVPAFHPYRNISIRMKPSWRFRANLDGKRARKVTCGSTGQTGTTLVNGRPVVQNK